MWKVTLVVQTWAVNCRGPEQLSDIALGDIARFDVRKKAVRMNGSF